MRGITTTKEDETHLILESLGLWMAAWWAITMEQWLAVRHAHSRCVHSVWCMKWMMERQEAMMLSVGVPWTKKRKMFTNASMPLVVQFHFDMAHCANAIYHNTFNYPSDDFDVKDFFSVLAPLLDLVKCFHPCEVGVREKIAFLAMGKVKTRQGVCVCGWMAAFFCASATHDKQSCVATEAVNSACFVIQTRLFLANFSFPQNCWNSYRDLYN